MSGIDRVGRHWRPADLRLGKRMALTPEQVQDVDRKVAFAILAYEAMTTAELLESVEAQQRQICAPHSSDEVRAIAARCLEVCRGLLAGNDR